MSYMDQPPAQPFGAPGMGAAPTFTLAPWIKRVGAYLIDSVLAGIISWIGLATGKGPLIFLFDLGSLAFWLWNYVWRQGTTGQSLGKTALHLKLVREADAMPLGPGLAFGRGLLHIIDAIPFYLGFLWPLWDVKRQTFSDKIVHSVVVEV